RCQKYLRSIQSKPSMSVPGRIPPFDLSETVGGEDKDNGTRVNSVRGGGLVHPYVPGGGGGGRLWYPGGSGVAMAATVEKIGDFYAVLGLRKECSEAELRIAYKKLAMVCLQTQNL
ncbi:hypothetical protein BHM03_00045080, partial [Ensete ventricosum]